MALVRSGDSVDEHLLESLKITFEPHRVLQTFPHLLVLRLHLYQQSVFTLWQTFCSEKASEAS